MDKHVRQFTIKEVIDSMPVTSQDELRVALKKRGMSVTQATLSRDLKELGVSWVSTGSGGRYVLQPQISEVAVMRPIVGPQVISIKANESMIVIHTYPGSASVVAEFIDAEAPPDIIGTIAGDNTILIIPQTHRKTKQLLQFLKDKLIEGVQ
jgi:transcriptional regulator of arginine metabolism